CCNVPERAVKPIEPFALGTRRWSASIVLPAGARLADDERRSLPTRTITERRTPMLPDGCRSATESFVLRGRPGFLALALSRFGNLAARQAAWTFSPTVGIVDVGRIEFGANPQAS